MYKYKNHASLCFSNYVKYLKAPHWHSTSPQKNGRVIICLAANCFSLIFPINHHMFDVSTVI